MASGLDSLFTKASGLDVRNGSVFAAALPPSSPPPPPLVVVVAVVAPAAALNSFNRSLKTATVPLASSPLSSQHFTNSAFFNELNRVTGPAPLDDGGWEAACVFGVAIQTPSTQVDDRTPHRRRAQQPQSRQAYADSMALAAAYGRPPEPRYEQPAPTYGDPGPYRAQEPLPSQLARPAKKKRPRRKHGELARGIVRRREDWDDHCLIEMDDGCVSCVC